MAWWKVRFSTGTNNVMGPHNKKLWVYGIPRWKAMFEADNSNVIRWIYGITRWKAMFETGTTNNIIGWITGIPWWRDVFGTGTTNNIIGWITGIPWWKDMFGTGTNATISVFLWCTKWIHVEDLALSQKWWQNKHYQIYHRH